jgi:hypothetical protein
VTTLSGPLQRVHRGSANVYLRDAVGTEMKDQLAEMPLTELAEVNAWSMNRGLRELAGTAMKDQLAEMPLTELAEVNAWSMNRGLRELAGTAIMRRAMVDTGLAEMFPGASVSEFSTSLRSTEATTVLHNLAVRDAVPTHQETSSIPTVNATEDTFTQSEVETARLLAVWREAGWGLLILLRRPKAKTVGIPTALFLMTAWYLAFKAQHPAVAEEFKEPFWGAVFMVLGGWLAIPQVPNDK